jgi:hypothetical protein
MYPATPTTGRMGASVIDSLVGLGNCATVRCTITLVQQAVADVWHRDFRNSVSEYHSVPQANHDLVNQPSLCCTRVDRKTVSALRWAGRTM